MIRGASAALYAAFAALGAAVLARPAVLWVRGLGLSGPVLPWPVSFGWAAVLLGAALAAVTFALALRRASGRPLRLPQAGALLLLVALALALRAGSGDLLPPPDPAPRLVDGLRTAANVLDAEYAVTRRYAPTAAIVQGALSALPPPGFVHRARALRLSARILHAMRGAQAEPLPGDEPGTIYVCISSDEQRAWLSVLSLDAVLPLTIESRAGTHSAPGFDPSLPLYPNARPARP
jgi:hypothetical protein